MSYRTLRQCIDDLAATGRLVRIEQEIDAELEAAEIQRRVYRAGGPAIYFARVKGCRFPMVGNLFGTIERMRYLFRDTLDSVQRLIEMKIDPAAAMRRPFSALATMWTARRMLPRSVRRGPVLSGTTTIGELPQLRSWPCDGGAFITWPLVYTEDPDRPGFPRSNLGVYRVQLSGGQYQPNAEVGLHYQIHRGIGIHHAAAIRRGEPLRANIFVGGAPAMTVAAVMPLPEGLSELGFAGALGGRRVPMIRRPGGLPIYAQADFCITGTVEPNRRLPEGPFGDHLGYYSLEHDFPVLRVERVYHRPDAIWPFTVVGRPPQEDTVFGQFIHELTGSIVPTLLPGVRAVQAVDAAGVHPLLLAIGSERYTPYDERRRPQELLTQANAILGQGQMSLAKYLWIVSGGDDPQLDIRDVGKFLCHALARVDWRRDLHFQTCTTIDTLDYSGTALNEGSKLVIAAAGPAVRTLPTELPADLRVSASKDGGRGDGSRGGAVSSASGFRNPRLCLPGVLAMEGPKFSVETGDTRLALQRFCTAFTPDDAINRFPLVVIVDDSEFTAASLANFLWVTFTRSNPAADVYGIGEFTQQKHWGCRGSLVIDARTKPHHAPPLVEDPAVSRRVDQLAASGGPLHGVI
ncbi:MAG TPA: UbiD family decarboxylase [Pirellulales bacterium]|jgi:4-hydroxy-3-polyprenylbenzoate decarboxylase|nr:UbiD family decarboxylase [Pirellulales bacterium]